jgi:hypothetical protein
MEAVWCPKRRYPLPDCTMLVPYSVIRVLLLRCVVWRFLKLYRFACEKCLHGVRFEKLIFAYLVSKFLATQARRRFISVFTGAVCWTLAWARKPEFTVQLPISFVHCTGCGLILLQGGIALPRRNSECDATSRDGLLTQGQHVKLVIHLSDSVSSVTWSLFYVTSVVCQCLPLSCCAGGRWLNYANTLSELTGSDVIFVT